MCDMRQQWHGYTANTSSGTANNVHKVLGVRREREDKFCCGRPGITLWKRKCENKFKDDKGLCQVGREGGRQQGEGC